MTLWFRGTQSGRRAERTRCFHDKTKRYQISTCCVWKVLDSLRCSDIQLGEAASVLARVVRVVHVHLFPRCLGALLPAPGLGHHGEGHEDDAGCQAGDALLEVRAALPLVCVAVVHVDVFHPVAFVVRSSSQHEDATVQHGYAWFPVSSGEGGH